jgi:glycine/D-amino acid oxidase-like deaminating enzyme
VVVIGAGPIGLATAAHLRTLGASVTVLECGGAPGAAIREWQHVTLFSPWPELLDPVAVELVNGSGWQRGPAGGLPTGCELVDRYLEPLAVRP